jgi:hypothetical protein
MNLLLKSLLQRNRKHIHSPHDMIVLYVHFFIFEYVRENKVKRMYDIFDSKQKFFPLFRQNIMLWSYLIFFTIDNVPKCIRLVENDGKVEILYVVSLNYLQMKL